MSGRYNVSSNRTPKNQRMLQEIVEPRTSANSIGDQTASTDFLSDNTIDSSALTKNPFGFSPDDDMLDITTDARRDVSDLVDRSQGSKNLMDVPGVEDSTSRTHYDDFHTIDWLKVR